MNENEQLILAIVFSIVGFISIVIIIFFLILFILRYKSKSLKHKKHSSISRRQQYQQSQKIAATNAKRKKKFNTNDSAISLSFNPPHLINQNVKNLDQLFSNESSLNYKNKLPKTNFDCCHINPAVEPVYTSSSSISNLALSFRPYPHSPQLNNLHFQFLNELNNVLCSKQEQRLSNPQRYPDLLPFGYYPSITPSTDSSNENLFQPNNYSNTTLMHNIQLRDDTAILF